MFSDTLPVCFILLNLLPGVLCKYDFDVGGLVAASIMGFFMLVLIVIMIIVIVMWRDWYERKQILKGHRKRPRNYWGLFPAKSKSPSILISTPRSDHKPYVVGQRLIRESRDTTLTRADEWLTKLPPPPAEFSQVQNRYEEKVQTMNFEPEEEAVIVADILPDNTHRASRKVTQQYVNGPAQSNYQSTDGGNTLYISYKAPKTNPESRQIIRTAPYHVKMGQVGESSTSEDMYVASPTSTQVPESQPLGYTITREETEVTPGPSGIGRESYRVMVSDDGPRVMVSDDGPRVMVTDDTDRPAVMEFQDSDEEAGMIPTTQARGEGDVLF